jgi:ribosome-binding protein aMBF1 (putative translation factor)
MTMSRKSWQDVRTKRLATPAARDAYWRAERASQIGEEVRRLREAAGLSQRQLAEKMGSTQSVIARLEAGGVEPTLATLDRVAAALGAGLDVHFAATA